MAARFKIIVLDSPKNEQNAFNVAMWADVPAGREAFFANPNATSAWTGANAGDKAALVAGTVVERVTKISRSQGGTLAQMQADAITAQQVFQAEISTNLWTRYGSTYDGTTWVAGGVS
jgi:hypothetical protein